VSRHSLQNRRKSLPVTYQKKKVGYYPEYIKSSKKSNTKGTNNPINKWANKLNRKSSK
jgi:hypothetical protein